MTLDRVAAIFALGALIAIGVAYVVRPDPAPAVPVVAASRCECSCAPSWLDHVTRRDALRALCAAFVLSSAKRGRARLPSGIEPRARAACYRVWTWGSP